MNYPLLEKGERGLVVKNFRRQALRELKKIKLASDGLVLGSFILVEHSRVELRGEGGRERRSDGALDRSDRGSGPVGDDRKIAASLKPYGGATDCGIVGGFRDRKITESPFPPLEQFQIGPRRQGFASLRGARALDRSGAI